MSQDKVKLGYLNMTRINPSAWLSNIYTSLSTPSELLQKCML